MNKKLKMAIFSILLMPCILFATACSSSITLDEYYKHLKESAINYYSNFDGKNITINSKSTHTESWSEDINYGKNNENTQSCEFSNTTESIQTIEFDTSSDYKNIRITNIITTKSLGKEENEEENGIKEYSNTEISTEIVTFIQSSSDWTIYQSLERKINNNKPTIEKKKYSYISKSLYLEDLNDILENIDETIFEEAFFSTTSMLEMLSQNSSSEFYKDNNKFGHKYDMNYTQIKDKCVNLVKISIENMFADNLPSTIIANMTQNVTNNNKNNTKHNIVNSIYSEIKLTYSADTIATPSDFDNATTTSTIPNTPIQGLYNGMI